MFQFYFISFKGMDYCFSINYYYVMSFNSNLENYHRKISRKPKDWSKKYKL